MARARNIKPGFFQNDELGELQPIARLLFIGLWTIADFKGCLEFRPKRIKAQILPYDDCDIESLAFNLDHSGFISIYSVAGQRYLKIINFERHQNPHKNEREAGSDCPDISEKDSGIKHLEIIEINLEQDGSAPADSLILIPDSLFSVTDSLTRNPESLVVEQKSPDQVQTIFAYWQKIMESPKSVMDGTRKALITKALKNYEPADICKAVRGCFKSPFNMGQNDRNTKYNGLNLILRDAEHIDYFINLDDANARPGAETIAQMNARVTAEFLGDAQNDDSNTIEMAVC